METSPRPSTPPGRQAHPFIAYTVKGFGLPLQGHKDNHAGLMTATQVEALRQAMGGRRARSGRRWPVSARGGPGGAGVHRRRAFAQPSTRQFTAAAVRRRDGLIPSPDGAEQATQQAFGKILLELAKSGHPWPTASSPPRRTSRSPPTSAGS